jgi:hypothetical protein
MNTLAEIFASVGVVYIPLSSIFGYAIGYGESMERFDEFYRRKHQNQPPQVSTLYTLGFSCGFLGMVIGPVLTPVYVGWQLHKAWKDIKPKTKTIERAK